MDMDMDMDKKAAAVHSQQATASAKRNDYNGAIIHYRKAIELDANQPAWVYADLGHQLLRTNQIDEAETMFQVAREKHPQKPHGFAGLAVVAQRRRYWELALERWTECLAKFPEQAHGWWHIQMGNALLELEQYQKAQDLFEALRTNNPQELAGWVGLAQVAARKRDWKSALQYWSDVADHFPGYLNALIQQGYTLIQLKQFEQAEKVFTLARDRSPESLEPIQGMVNLAINQGHKRLVIKHINDLLKLFPDHVPSRLHKAFILSLNGNLNFSVELINEILIEKRSNITSIDIFRQIFQIIQFSFDGHDRIDLLKKLCFEVQKNSQSRLDEKAECLIAEIFFSLGDLEYVSNCVSNFKNNLFQSDAVISLCRVVKKYHLPDYPDYFAPKVFGIGLSKTATSSLNDALNDLGMHSIHWVNPHTMSVISREDFFLFDCFTDVCISCQFENLFHTFPNSKFIYTTRSLEDWTRSVKHHYSNIHGIYNPKELRAPAFKKRLSGLPGWAEMNLYAKHDSWEEAYIEFDRRVRRFFQDKPPEKFLELRICDGEGWDELCAFLGKDVPQSRFPISNKARYSQ